MAMDITKEIKAIRAKAEKELGFPLREKFWNVVEKDIANTAEDFDGDPEGQESYISSYQSVSERYVMVMKMAPTKVKSSTDGNGEPSQPKKRYRKCFERQFYLVDFIERNGLNPKTSHIDWKRTVAVWNEAHPSDMMSLPVLKVEYYRARREEGMVLQVLATNLLRIGPYWWHRFHNLKRLEELPPMIQEYDKFAQQAGDVIHRYIEMNPPGEFLLFSVYRLSNILSSIDEKQDAKRKDWLDQLKAEIRDLEKADKKGGTS